MGKNTGNDFEEEVFRIINKLVENNKFLVANPYVKVRKGAEYYSKDREANIKCDVSVEKYLGDFKKDKEQRPSIIVIIECKDYGKMISVDEVEEFHAKLQQIGADNTKGIMITRNAVFQRGALQYAKSKGIALARILPENQVENILYELARKSNMSFQDSAQAKKIKIVCALTQKDYVSEECERFFSLTGESSLGKLIGQTLSGN